MSTSAAAMRERALRAKEQISLKAEKAIQEEFNDIMLVIQDAADRGYFSCQVTPITTDVVKLLLERDGYIITRNTSEDKYPDNIKISWN